MTPLGVLLRPGRSLRDSRVSLQFHAPKGGFHELTLPLRDALRLLHFLQQMKRENKIPDLSQDEL